MAEGPSSRVAVEHTKFNFFPNQYWCNAKYRRFESLLRQALGGRRDILAAIGLQAVLDCGKDPSKLVDKIVEVASILPKPEGQRMTGKDIQWHGHNIRIARSKRPTIRCVCAPFVDSRENYDQEACRIIRPDPPERSHLDKLLQARWHYGARPLLVLECTEMAYDPIGESGRVFTKELGKERLPQGFHAIIVCTCDRNWLPVYVLWDDDGNTLDPYDDGRIHWLEDRLNGRNSENEQ